MQKEYRIKITLWEYSLWGDFFMRKFAVEIALTLCFTILIPLVIYFYAGKYQPPAEESAESVFVYDKARDEVIEMNKSQYLKEVVSAEMPADFEKEALKAQAVAARSYLDARISTNNPKDKENVHKGAPVCTDSTHCKAWIPEEKRRELWGSDADKNWAKISLAVEETAGEVMTYDGEIISAVFHSTSSGKTEASKDVWGGERPYLISVESPGDKHSPKYKSEAELSLEEFKSISAQNIPGVDFSKEIVGEILRSEAGGILEISIGGVKIKGTEFRKIFGLRSTNVNISIDESLVHFDVTGYGHGVGMSQYGANYLAAEGKSYQDILKTYYTGIEIVKKGNDKQ